MRHLRLSLFLFAAFIVGIPVSAQSTTSPQIAQDSQAVSLLSRALIVGGGAQAVAAISDYTATGDITYYQGEPVEGAVTVIGTNSQELRIDATLPTGAWSWAVHDGIISTKTEDRTVTSFGSNTNVPSSDAYPYQTPLFAAGLLFPVGPLAVLTSHQTFSILYNGIAQIDGHVVHDITVHLGPPGPPSIGPTREIFIDTTTFQIVMVRDHLPRAVVQEVHYSDYRTVDAVLMPFSVAESTDGRPIWAIQVNEITFNSALQASAFVIQ